MNRSIFAASVCRPAAERDGAAPEVALNLTPLLDVLSNIMFFLLSTFGASAIAVLSVSVPLAGTDDGPPPMGPAPVTVTLQVDTQALTLDCSAADRPPEVFSSCRQRLPRHAAAADRQALQQALQRIRNNFAEAGTLVVLPQPPLPFAELVAVLDAARAITLPDGSTQPLFAQQVLARLDGAAEVSP